MTSILAPPHGASSSVCPICRATALFWGSSNRCSLFRCPSCRLLFVDPIPEHTNVYSSDYFSGGSAGFGYVDYDRDKSVMQPELLRFLRRLRALTKATQPTLLDVGAATGFFLNLAREVGFQVSGVELSEYAAELARQKGLDVRSGCLEDQSFEPGAFDVVTLLDVLEHVRDPRMLLAEVHRILAPGGIVVVNTPNADSLAARILGQYWHLIKPPEHLHYFNRYNLQKLMLDLGLTLEASEHLHKRFTPPYIFRVLQQRFKWSFLGRVADACAKSCLSEIGIPIPTGDNMLLIAKRCGETNQASSGSGR
jgi:SAM-dependent methyltransferase